MSVDCLLLGDCASRALSFLSPRGQIAAAQRAHLFEVLKLLAVVVLPVLMLAPYVAWRYRYSNKPANYKPQWKFSWPLEFAIWGIPVFITLILISLLWKSTHELDPYKPLNSSLPPLRVEAVGYDWKWLFIYPDEGIATVNELVFPAGRPLSLELTSATVMQSFMIPALGSQIYAMGGMNTRLNLSADEPGSYLGENTQYNGKGFHQQKFTARSVSQDDFREWLQKSNAGALPFDNKVMSKLSEKNTATTLSTELARSENPTNILVFRNVPANLFSNIVHETRGQTVTKISGVRQTTGKTASETHHAHR